MKKILVSYFAPFGILPTNSSFEVAKRIDMANVDKIELEVKYQKDFKTLMNATFNKDYDYILMLGQARGRDHISLESRATNLNNPKAADNDNFYPNEEIIEGGSHYLYTKVDIEGIISKINKEIVSISKNAGSYLCNYIYYLCLNEIKIPSLFIHLPSFAGQGDEERIPTLKLDEMVDVIKQIIMVLSEDTDND